MSLQEARFERICPKLHAFREEVRCIERKPRPPGQHFNLTPQLLEYLLAKFPSDTSRTFEHYAFALLCPYATQDEKAEAFGAMLDAIVRPSPTDTAPNAHEDVRYAALYALCMLKRRDHDPKSYEALLNDAASWAKERATFPHLQAMMHVLFRGHDRIRMAMTCAMQAAEAPRLKDHIGVQHHLAEVIAAEAEEADKPDQSRLRHALRLADDAMAAEPDYAKFCATRGRLKALLDPPDFEGASDDLRRAIEEERADWNSAARRTDYKDMLMDITHLRRLQSQERRLTHSMRNTAEDTKIRHAEMLGFFAGVLALILAGIQLAVDPKDGGADKGSAFLESVLRSGSVLLMLGGTLLVSFGGLGWLLRHETSNIHLRSVRVVRLGVFLFAVGLAAPVAFNVLHPLLFASVIAAAFGLSLVLTSDSAEAKARSLLPHAKAYIGRWRNGVTSGIPAVRSKPL